MAKKLSMLIDVEADEVSVVDKGAAQHSRIVLAKRAPEEGTVSDFFDEDGDVLDVDDLNPGDLAYDSEGNQYVYVVDEEADDDDEVADENDYEPELVGKNFADQIRTDLSKAFSDIERDDVVSKALGRAAEFEARAVAAEEIAKSERDLRLTREYISKAAEYGLGDEADLGPVLMRMADTMSYEDCVVIHKALSSAGAVMDELGVYGGADPVNDVLQQVESLASESVAKSANGQVSKEATVTQLFESNPDAYDEYMRTRYQG